MRKVEKKLCWRPCTHTHTHTHTWKNVRKKQIFTNLKKRFEHIELPAKLLDYFLRSKKSNINHVHMYICIYIAYINMCIIILIYANVVAGFF